MKNEIDNFLQHIADGKQLSPHTVSAYTRDVKDFLDFLNSYYGSKEDWLWNGVDRLAFRAYLGHLKRAGLSRRTIARKLSAVRSFFRYMHREEIVEANPARAVRSPKLERHLPGWLTRAQIEDLFVVAENRAAEGGFHTARDLAVLETFYAAGIRLSELQGLDVQ